ncbi:hypothetical protein BGZ83_003864, partial [Gryganskiella cystojenkinii]
HRLVTYHHFLVNICIALVTIGNIMPTLAVIEIETSKKNGRTRIGVGFSRRTICVGICIFVSFAVIAISVVTTVLVLKSKEFDNDAAKSKCEFDCGSTLNSCNFDCGAARSGFHYLENH